MVMVTNKGATPENFHVAGGKKGAPKYEALAPGESRNLDLADRHSAHNVGRELAGLIIIADKAGKEVASAQAAATAPANPKA